MNNIETSDSLCLKMLVFVVPKGMGTKVSVEAKKHGALRPMILLGKGTAPKKVYLDFLGIAYDPEKEVVLMLVQKKCLRDLIDTLTQLTHIDRPGHGIAFVLDVSQYSGWINLLQGSSDLAKGGKDAN